MPRKLSGQELFQFRTPLDKSLPQKGGAKDYAPDGSWLQAKKMEKFHEERLHVLSEPRVERSCDLVKGEWNQEKCLVEFEREQGKFWIHMGFVDVKRKWLYPEEALFLMETNLLEVWYKGLPLSLQQAYMLFLGSSVKLEHYQVYSHLRRIGYVVLRHQGRLNFTRYEKQLRLDKYAEKKKRKRKQKERQDGLNPEDCDGQKSHNTDIRVKQEGDISDEEADMSLSKKAKVTGMSIIGDQESTEVDVTMDTDVTKDTNQSRYCLQIDMECIESDSSCVPSQDMNDSSSDHGSSVQSVVVKSNRQPDDGEFNDINTVSNLSQNNLGDAAGGVIQFSDTTSDKLAAAVCDTKNELGVSRTDELNKSENERGFYTTKYETLLTSETETDITVTESDFNHGIFLDVNFPDIGGKDVLVLPRPHNSLLPKNLDLTEDSYIFDIKNYHKSKQRFKSSKKDQNIPYLYELDFSYAEFTRSKVRRRACNWKEYKDLLQKEETDALVPTPVEHLWKEGEEVVPLMRPEEAISSAAILQKLQIIKEVCLTKTCKGPCSEGIIQYDVYLPDLKFKKTQPGVPNHRVGVVKSSEPTPSVSELSAIYGYLDDDVPLHWAVVDSGEIAFYVFSPMSLPVDITVG